MFWTGLADLRRAASRVTDLAEPFMSLSFLALPVIPKLTDRGLVDVELSVSLICSWHSPHIS